MMGAEVAIRRMDQQDLPRIREITGQVFRPVAIVAKIEDEFGKVRHDWLELKMQQIDDDIRADAGGCLVAVADGVVAGYVTSTQDQRSGIGRIPNLAVAKEFQGMGISRRLLEAAQQYLKDSGMDFAKIETLENNEFCREYYPRLGFREIARQIHFVKKL